MIIKDALIEPFYIERDYNGYYLLDSRNKKEEKLIQKIKIEEILTDIVNRKIGENKEITDLKGYIAVQQKLYTEIGKALEVQDSNTSSSPSVLSK